MSLITTKTGRLFLKKAESMMLVPYVYDSTVSDYVLGGDVYDISAIIGDSTTLEQSDGDSVTKNNEFIGSPLLECFSGGEYGFTAQCVDLQNKVLKSVFGAMTVSNTEGAAAFNDDFTLIYALVRIRFKDSSLPDVVMPKVQLNSKLFINQLKTRESQGNIAGTALSRNVAIKGSGTSGTVLQFTTPTTYTPYTPVLFVPRDKFPLVLHHNGSSTTDTYSTVDFTNGTVSHNIEVNPSTGAFTTSSSQSSGTGGSNEVGGSTQN